MNSTDLLVIITKFYLKSSDFNGMSSRFLIEQYGVRQVRRDLSSLLKAGSVSLVFGDSAPNPHIKALPPEPVEDQLAKLKTTMISQACVYPTSRHLQTVVKPAKFRDRPYERCLALGEPQLCQKSFDLTVLETYRNEPRYSFQYGDLSGSIAVKDDGMRESDEILLKTFGFSFDKDGNLYVAVFLRYLSQLIPEQQRLWASEEVKRETQLHPDYFRMQILGVWPERISLYEAVLLEMKTINQISKAIGRKPLFKKDFTEDRRPRDFGYILRPTQKEYYGFARLLDKMLSDNIDKGFFAKEVPLESEERRNDRKIEDEQKATITLLKDWLESTYRADDCSEIDEMIATFRLVRKHRSKDAHVVMKDEHDQKYVHKQRDLMWSVYRAVKVLRTILQLHPRAKGIEIPSPLRDGLIWPM